MLRRDLDEVHVDGTPVVDHRETVGRLEVLNPIGDVAEHRDDITIAFEGGQDDRIRALPVRSAIAHFERDPRRRSHAPAGCPAEGLADPMAEPRRPAVAVEETMDHAALGGIGRGEPVAFVHRWDHKAAAFLIAHGEGPVVELADRSGP